MGRESIVQGILDDDGEAERIAQALGDKKVSLPRTIVLA